MATICGFNCSLAGCVVEVDVGFRQRLEEIRTGFELSFWVANFTEIFERLAYYGQLAVLAIYLHEFLHFSDQQASELIGAFGFVVWFLPVLGGTLADRFGFRRALAAAYLILTIGYFLLGSLAAPWMAPVRNTLPLYWLVLAILMVPALGPSVVKPCVVGTTARSAKEEVRSIGYSIYYTVVNIGGTLGPFVASYARKWFGVQNAIRFSSVYVFLMFLVVLLFYREPARSGEAQVESVAQALKNMFVVLGDLRFVLFLLIFSGYWVVYWEQFIALPLYIRGFVNSNSDIDRLLSVDALTVILFQFAVTELTRRMPTFRCLTLGTLITSLAWVILALPAASGTWDLRVGSREFSLYSSSLQAAAALVVVALGEMTQAPRYYEYISRLAPPGQQGLFMGYSFLPIAIGFFISGQIGGRLLHHYGEVLHRPNQMWWVVVAVGIGTTALMWLYDKIFKPGRGKTAVAAS